jgi:hypothetical protein
MGKDIGLCRQQRRFDFSQGASKIQFDITQKPYCSAFGLSMEIVDLNHAGREQRQVYIFFMFLGVHCG